MSNEELRDLLVQTAILSKETLDIANSNARSIKALTNDVSIIKQTTKMRMEFFEADQADHLEETRQQGERIERILVILERTLDIGIANQADIKKLKDKE